MARPIIQDKPPKSAATSFDREPSGYLEDTRPFSLLNALLEGVDGAPFYEPPSFELIKEDSFPLQRIKASEKEERTNAKSELRSEMVEESLSSEISPESDSEALHSEKPLLTETTSTSQETVSKGTHSSPKLPFTFPKISGELPPLPPPPRPKRRHFSTPAPSFSKVIEQSKSRHESPQGNQQWPRRGFQDGKVRRPHSLAPIDKAIRIFESLSSDSEEEPDSIPAKPPLNQRALPSIAEPSTKDRQPTDQPDDKAAVATPTEPAPRISEASPNGHISPTTEAPRPDESTPLDAEPRDIDDPAELATVKIQVAKAKAPAPLTQAPTPKPQVPSALPVASQPSALRPPVEVEKEISPEPIVAPSAQGEIRPLPSLKPTPSQTPVRLETPLSNGAAVHTPIPVRHRRRRRVPLNPWTAKRTSALEANLEDRRRHIDKTLGDLAKMLEATLQTEPTPAAREETKAPTKKVTLNGSFPENEDTPSTRPISRVKLVPRALSKSDTENAALQPPSDLAKPSPAPDFEITAPTTLVAKNAPISPFTKVAQGQTKAPHTSTSAPIVPDVPKSLFTLASTQRVVSQTPPISPETSQPKVFASPFSTALKKREENSSKSTKSSGKPVTAPPALKITPISPPETHPDQEAALSQGQLPAPTYSFATIGLPSVHSKVPYTKAPQAAAPLHVSPTPAPVARGPFTQKTGTKKFEASPETSRKQRPRPEQESWGILTWALCIVCGAFSVTWMFEIYRTLSEPGPAPIPQGGAEAIRNQPKVLRPEAITAEPTLDRPGIIPPSPSVSLKAPIDCVASFLSAETVAIRHQYLIEAEDLHERMAKHHDSFPMQASTFSKTTDSGKFPDTGRSYVTVRTVWANEHQSDTVLIKDEQGDYHFSWYAFEQARSQLLRHYAETDWSGWTQFFIEIKSIDPSTLPPGSVLENIYYRITVPEDPEFEAVGYVDGLSSMAIEFKERFTNNSTYQVYVDLMRGERLPDDRRPLFRITRLIRASWDATP